MIRTLLARSRRRVRRLSAASPALPLALAGLLALAACGGEPGASDERIIVSGASGQLGSMVVRELLDRGVAPERLILVSRTPDELAEFASLGASTRFGDFEQPESLPAAYEGGARMLLISINPHPERAQLHRNAIDAASAAGVRHIAYVSSVDVENPNSASATDHRATEEYLRGSGVAWTMLRNHLYADGLVGQAARMVSEGRVEVQPDEIPTAYVTRRDCAAAAAGVLTGEGHEGQAYDVTGSELVLRRDVAALASELTGRPIEIVVGEGGVPQMGGVMAGFASYDVRSDAVQRLAGRPPTSLRDLLESNRDALLGGER